MQPTILKLFYLGLLAITIVWGGGAVAEAQPDPNRIEYWRSRFRELKPAEDPRVQKAHDIFQRLIQVAGRRSDVHPKLFIIQNGRWDITLPIALSQGWIVLSKRVLDICYREPNKGDDRLAFILGHELSHQLLGDVWHLRFFQGVANDRLAQHLLDDVRHQFSKTEHVLARELRADESGIIYATMAGFDPHAIITEDNRVNFFVDWVRALNPSFPADQLHPTLRQRAEELKAHLRRVVDQTALFQAGLWWYYAGDYPQAIQAFTQFRSLFPSREVIHNLATSHHRLALQMYRAWKPGQSPVPFQMSMAIDPETRASKIYQMNRTARFRSLSEPVDRETLFRQHLDQAIQLYNEALQLERSYVASARNLGNALIVRGIQGTGADRQADLSEAVMRLSRALKYKSTDAAILTTLGVAFYYEGRIDRAKTYLQQARSLAPGHAAPICNLGQIAQREDRHTETQHYQRQCQQLRSAHSMPPSAARHLSPEHLQELVIGDYIPSHWQTQKRSTFELNSNAYYRLETYAPGITTLTRSGEIIMAMAHPDYPGQSGHGIRVGSSGHDVLASYGPPTRRLLTTNGQSWSYDARGIAFQLTNHRVVSWLIYPETLSR